MKYTRVTILMLVIVFLMTACNTSETTDNSISFEWDTVIRNDLLSGETKLERMVAEKVEIQVTPSNGILDITISAPDICDELLAWMNAIDDADFTEEALETEIIRLLDTVVPTITDFSLPYTQEESVAIEYSQEFTDVLSCGLSRFNREITQYIMEAMVN